jgi:hypothetical protein
VTDEILEPSKKRLQKAADAAGLSLQELVDLAASSGFGSDAAQAPGLADRLSVKQLGHGLFVQLHNNKLPEDRAKFVRGLTPTQQEALVVHLRTEGRSTQTISSDLGLPHKFINQAFQKHADDTGRNLVSIRLSTILGATQLAAEKAAELALAKDDPSTFWRIHKDLVAILQSVGIVDKAAQKVDHEVSVKLGEDEKKAILDRMLEMREKQRLRVEEIKQADAELLQEDTLTDVEETFRKNREV